MGRWVESVLHDEDPVREDAVAEALSERYRNEVVGRVANSNPNTRHEAEGTCQIFHRCRQPPSHLSSKAKSNAVLTKLPHLPEA